MFGLEALLKLDFDGDGLPEGYPDEVKNTFDNLVLFGADAYDATQFLGGCQAMIKMAQMLGDEGEARVCAKCSKGVEQPRDNCGAKGRTRKARNSNITSLASIPSRATPTPTFGPTNLTPSGI